MEIYLILGFYIYKSIKFGLKENMSKSIQSGSETIKEKIAKKVPWICGNKIRKPKVRFPKIKIVKRFSLPTPSKNLGLMGIYVFLFILQLGVIYIIYREPIPLGADPSTGDPMFIYPDMHDAFIIESIVGSILIFISSSGFIAIYQATKYTYDRSFAWRLLLIGVVLALIGFISLQYIIAVKQGDILQGTRTS